MSEDMNKDHEATPFKLAEARRKGQVARSTEIASFFGNFGAIATLIATLSASCFLIAKLTTWWFSNAHSFADNKVYLWSSLVKFSINLTGMVAAIILAGLITAIVAGIVHVGPVFSFYSIRPDFSKINPSKGFKKVFSRKSLVDSVRLLMKIAAFSAVAYLFWRSSRTEFFTSNSVSLQYVLQSWKNIFVNLAFAMLGVFFIFAVFDLWFSKKEFARQMRMSTKDVKDENKRREGDPEIKAKRKKALKELLSRASSVSNVKDSDVIITNPTHVSIALQYRPATMLNPIVLSKGTGLTAAAIRAQARKHGIPIVRKPKLARSLLLQSNIGDVIPAEHQAAIASIYRWVISLPNSKVFL